MLTRKDFIGLAKVMQTVRPATYIPEYDPVEYSYYCGRRLLYLKIIDSMAEWLATQNPRFDRQKWLDYINKEDIDQ